MDSKFEAFLDLYNRYKGEGNSEWLAGVALEQITESNVDSILKLLAGDKNGISEEFWKNVNSLPHTDEGWADIVFIVGEVNHEEYKARQRKAVEVVRSKLKVGQLKINQMFGKKW